MDDHTEDCNCDQALGLKNDNERLWKIIKKLRKDKNDAKNYSKYIEKQNHRLWASFNKMMDRFRKARRENSFHKII